MLLKYIIGSLPINIHINGGKKMAFSFLKRNNVETINKSEKIEQGCKDLEKVLVNLSKETGINLNQTTVRVAVVMDHSGSIRPKFDSGKIQEVLNKILPMAIKFDDNGQLEVFLFDDVCRKMEKDMNLKNYEDYVQKQIIKKGYEYGGTRYAPAISMTDKYYNDEESKKIPTIVFFITDGENFDSDRIPSDEAIIESSKHGIFYMFIGVGKDNFDYLRHLDDLKGRKYDNTGFMKFSDFGDIKNVEMFTNALKDYVPWLKAKGYVR